MWRSTHSISWLIAALVGVAAPVQAQAPDDTNNQMSVGYEYRSLIKKHLRVFGDLVYEERDDPDSPSGSENNLS
ncbi:MAG: hypothetical protein IFK93_15245, partial [Acidobacteria bacterium]|nr:hypothetical protein [Candidatus Sulfomarinibacter kjeldsenii]